MSLTEGTQLGVYQITGQIGAGGMGEVYRATDTKLGRDVAIKTLPAALASDKDRLARFEREAKLLAALNHPHIASIYSLDEHEGTLYLAMELIDGETLEEKLKPGALPVDDALRLALQIAEALEAAHGKGVVHRDLKPANVMVTQDGVVKVLDFGLAKAFSEDPEQSNAAQSPALSVAMTQQGLVLGTAGYMSPEQASGQGTDQRADIWAFGVVLYEMLTGLPLFSGESVPHILADVLKTEPDWNRLPRNLHHLVRHALERCLTKNPRNRYHSIADARVDIQQALGDPAGVTPAIAEAQVQADRQPPLRRFGLPAGLMALAAAVAGVAVWYLTLPAPPVPAPVNHFEIPIPEEIPFRNTSRAVFNLSPDGRHFAIRTESGLYLRRMGQPGISLIQGTDESEPVYLPFFSPDGQSVAYSMRGGGAPSDLKKIPISGGASTTVAPEIPRPFGASWAADDMIYWGDPGGIARVPATGGEPEIVVHAEEGEQVQGPQLLPGGDLVLFTSNKGNDWDTSDVVVASITTGERTLVYAGGSDAHYVASGHLVFAYEDNLWGIAFDLETLTVSGGRVFLQAGLTRSNGTGAANYGIAEDGTLAYLSGLGGGGSGVADMRLVWVDRNGNEIPVPMEPCSCEITPYSLALSPDETQAALVIDADGETDIWVWNFATQTLAQRTFEPGNQGKPIWTADGARLIYISEGEGIMARAADGSGTIDRLLEEPSLVADFPDSLSLDAEGNVVFTMRGNIHVLSVADGTTSPLLADDSVAESMPTLSPNSRFIAYTLLNAGEPQVQVRPYPDVMSGGLWRISTGGGFGPRWSADGGSLNFANMPASLGELMAAPVRTEAAFSHETPAPLLSIASPGNVVLDISQDGERFLALKQDAGNLGGGTEEREGPRVIVIQNWIEKLKRDVPTN